MSIEPPSLRPVFEGFGAYYDAEIAPYLDQNEGKRREAVVNFSILAASVGVLALLAVFYLPFGAANLQAGILVLVLGLGVATWILNRARRDIAHGLLERICSRLGFAYRLKLDRPDYFAPFEELKMVGAFNREAWEDEVSGTYGTAAFKLCETHLKYVTSGKNKSTRTVFHGQLLVVDYPKRFLGVTVIKRDRGAFNAFGKPGKGFARVGLSSPAFEKAFEAWSTDQVEARDILDPIVLERFQELERLFGGKSLRAAFKGGQALIAIETGDRLNMGSMFKSLADKGRTQTILKEFDVIFDLIDILVKRAEGRLDGAFSVADVRQG